MRVLDDSDTDEPWQVSMLECLDPETADALYLFLLSAIIEGEGLDLDEEAEACLRGLLADTDIAEIFAAALPDAAPESAAMLEEFEGKQLTCLADLLPKEPASRPTPLTPYSGELDLDADSLWQQTFDAFSVSEQRCIRNELGDVFLESLLGMRVLDDPETDQSWQVSMFECLDSETANTLYVSILSVAADLDEEAQACVYGVLADIDIAEIFAAALPDAAPESAAMVDEFGSKLQACQGETASAPQMENGAYADTADDHGNDFDSATTAAVGVDVEGVLEYDGDIDVFHFTAEAGQHYQIDVSLGSLPDSFLVLGTSDGRTLESNDDHGDSPASRIVWKAPASRDYYLVVKGFGAGSYTLTVAYSDATDDHGNDLDNATAAAVGVDVEGVVDYEGDSDYFRFTAEGGQLYQIDVSLGSLRNSYLELRDSAGRSLASNDNHGGYLSSRVVWEAPASGDYYLAVKAASGQFTQVGSYTLTVSHSTTADDHGNYIGDGTTAAVGVDLEGVVDYEGDSDYFRFTAEGAQIYQIDVSLGSLPDSDLELRDSEGRILVSNDDHGDSSASRIVWKAPDAGEYFLVVQGSWDHQVGSYTLTIAAR